MNAPLLRQVLTHLQASQWTEAHNLVQQDDSPMAAWLHGIVHIQEGDLEDAEYWYGLAGRHFRSRGTLAEELERFGAALPVSERVLPAAAAAGPRFDWRCTPHSTGAHGRSPRLKPARGWVSIAHFATSNSRHRTTNL